MAGTKGLQVEADEHWQQREWVVHRVAWVTAAIVLILAALGLFGGGGALGSGTSRGDGFWLEYERFYRRDEPAEVNIELEPPVTEVVVELGREFLDDVDVQDVWPEPQSSTITERGLLLTFASEHAALQQVVIEYEADRWGMLPLVLDVDGERVVVQTFVYP